MTELRMKVLTGGTESFCPILIEGSVIKTIGLSHKTKQEARKEGSLLLKVATFKVQVCGNCEYWKLCKSTEGWRFFSPCSHEGGVIWEKKKSSML